MKLKKMNYSLMAGISLMTASFLTSSLIAQEEAKYGKFVGDFRARLETADQEGRDASDAVTLRSRVDMRWATTEAVVHFVPWATV